MCTRYSYTILNSKHTAVIDLPKASWKDMPVHIYYDLVFVKLKIVCCQTGKFFITSRIDQADEQVSDFPKLSIGATSPTVCSAETFRSKQTIFAREIKTCAPHIAHPTV